jgi:hypothetical protein
MPVATLTYGTKKVTAPADGSLFWDALESNQDKLDGHTHDGVNTPRIAGTTFAVTAAGWAASGIHYRQTITLPTGFTYDNTRISVRRSTGEQCYPTLEKISSTKFYIYTNDNTLAYDMSYV